jgi:inosose dehydratase
LNLYMIQLAGGPVSWGVDFADAPGNPPYYEVLAGIAAAGLRWMELGPVGYVPPRALAEHGLRAVGTFVFEAFHAAGRDEVGAGGVGAGGAGGVGARGRGDAGGSAEAAVLAAVDAALDAIAEAGGSLLVLIDRPSPERAATAGDSDAAPRLREPGPMLAALQRAGDRAAARGIRAVVHPHAGGYIEYEDEIERVLGDTGLGLCLDTGHALYAGSDPAALIRRYRGRLQHLHLKDVSPGPRPANFWDAVEAGAFCPIGEGLLDLEAVTHALHGYDGFATIEQDRRADSPGSPQEDLKRSVDRATQAGLAL